MTKITYQNVSIAAIVLLFLLLAPIQDKIDLQRKQMGFEQRLLLMPGQITGSLVLGGFKGLAADLLWLQVEDLFHSGQSYKMLPLFRTVTFLQPKFITPWAIGGWHLAYNISVQAKSVKERESWIQAGLNFLKEGISYNPDRYDLYFELGWTYFQKVKNYAEAVKYLEIACKFPRPDYVDDVLAHAYEKNGQINRAIETWEEIGKRGRDDNFSQLAPRMIHNLKTYGSAIIPNKK
jgi:tetratricopeptide (TPR) repeat protein